MSAPSSSRDTESNGANKSSQDTVMENSRQRNEAVARGRMRGGGGDGGGGGGRITPEGGYSTLIFKSQPTTRRHTAVASGVSSGTNRTAQHLRVHHETQRVRHTRGDTGGADARAGAGTPTSWLGAAAAAILTSASSPQPGRRRNRAVTMATNNNNGKIKIKPGGRNSPALANEHPLNHHRHNYQENYGDQDQDDRGSSSSDQTRTLRVSCAPIFRWNVRTAMLAVCKWVASDLRRAFK